MKKIRTPNRLNLFRPLVLVALLAGCASTGGDAAKIIGRTDDFVIVRAGQETTLESLAREFIGDPRAAAVIEDANNVSRISAGDILSIPRTLSGGSAVFADGYQIVPILCYHQFRAGNKTRHQMEVSQVAFERQMAYLAKNGYRVIPFSDLVGFVRGNRPIPRRSVVITIDDGYKSVLEVAYPILKKYGFPSTLFVYTDFIGGGSALSWDQLRAIQAEGLMDIQSHSKSHPSLSLNPGETLNDAYRERVATEVTTPHHLIQKRLGNPIRHFAYPFGDTSESVIELLEKHEYELGATVQRGGNPSYIHPMLLRRSMIYADDDLASFKKQLSVFSKVDLR